MTVETPGQTDSQTANILAHNPAKNPAKNPVGETTITPALDYHWTPANQRRFLEELSVCGNITLSAKTVSMSAQAAYAFRHRSAGVLFKMGWNAAALMARDRLSDELFERAMTGQTEIYERDADTGRVTRTRAHNGLGMAVLKRLDHMACALQVVPAETAVAQIVAGDFEVFLDLVSDEGEHDDKILSAALFLLERAGTVPVTQFWPAQIALHYQLALESADLIAAEVAEKQAAEAKAAAEKTAAEALLARPARPAPCDRFFMAAHSNVLMTNYPPPHGFDGRQIHRYGNPDYARALTNKETSILNELAALKSMPLRAADEAEHYTYFAELSVKIEKLREELDDVL